jgi:hypothetical protein
MWVIAISYPLLAVAPSVIALGIVGGASFAVIPILSVATFSYRAALVPDELQGRVASAFRLVSWGAQPIGALIGGVLLERIGAVDTLLVFFVGWAALAMLTTLNGRIRTAQIASSA